MKKLSLSLAALVGLVSAAFAFDEHIFRTEHVDIAVGYVNDQFVFTTNDEDNFVQYQPLDAVLLVNRAGRTLRPAGSQWDFIGVPAGTPIWVGPQTQNRNTLYLGFSTESIRNGPFTSPIRLTLLNVQGPGQFSVWQNGSFGQPQVRMATADGIGANDFIEALQGSHIHANWCMTAQGTYRITFKASGQIGSRTVESGPVTYLFAADRYLAPVPPLP